MESVVGQGTLLAGRYRTLQPLASDLPGATSWEATDQILDRPVRVTVLHSGHVPQALDAARRAALVTDPRLVRVLDVGDHEGAAYTVTEQVTGPSLAELVARGPLPADQARAIVGEAAAALEAARRRGVHHLTLRPSVLHLTPDDRVLMTGLAVDAALLGRDLRDTREDAAATRADTVGLVGLLYAALTGRWPRTVPAPSDGPLPHLAAAPVLEGGPVPPAELVSGVPNDLDTLCAVTLGVHDDGPRTPAELVRELEPWGDIRATDLFGTSVLPLTTSPVAPTAPVRRPEPPATPARVQRTSVRQVFAGGSSAFPSRPGTPPPAVPSRSSSITGPAVRAGGAAGAGAAAGAAGAAGSAVGTPGAATVVGGRAAGGTAPGSPAPDDAPTAALRPASPSASGRVPAGPPPAAPDAAATTRLPTTEATTEPPAAAPASPRPPAGRRPTSPVSRPSSTPGPAGPDDADARRDADARGGAPTAVVPVADPGPPTSPAAAVPPPGAPPAAPGPSGAAASVPPPRPVESPPPPGPVPTARATSADPGPGPAAPDPVRTLPAGEGGTDADDRTDAEDAPPAATTSAEDASRSPLLGLGARPGGIDVAAARESIAAHRFDPTRFVLLVVGVVLVLGLVAAYGALTRPVDLAGVPAPARTATAPVETPAPEDPADEEEPAPQTTTGPPVIASAAQLDPPPDGDENEHPEAVPLAVDGDPTTAWFTRTYNAPNFGGLKSGVGYAVTLAEPATVSTVTLQVRGTGGRVEVRATDPATPTQGEVLAEGALGPETVLTLSRPTQTQHVVLWFTELPQTADGSSRIELAEVTLS